jgi:hypothetical protein
MPNADTRTALIEVARLATFAENAIWMLWRLHDPITATDMVERRRVKDETGKWPKMEKYVLRDCPEGGTPTTIAKSLCPGLYSYVYDAIANQVSKLYRKKRFAYLTFQERLPCSRNLRIRFRERAIVVGTNDKGYELGFYAKQGEVLRIPVKTAGKSKYTQRWLGELAESGDHPSGGTITLKRRRGKWEWQIALARPRYEDERPRVTEPIEDRSLVCWAPVDQAMFLRCQVAPQNGRPWRIHVVSSDLSQVKRRWDKKRRAMGWNYRQSEDSAAHGHGRERAIRDKLGYSERYENRVTNWIEERTAAIVRFARQCRCSRIQCEDLAARDPSTLRLGSFPYYRLVLRIGEKAKDAGLKFSKFSGFEKVESLINGDGAKS